VAEGGPLSQIPRECLRQMALPHQGNNYFWEPHYAEMTPEQALEAIRAATDRSEDWAGGFQQTIVVDASQPLVFEVANASRALHSASVIDALALAKPEIQQKFRLATAAEIGLFDKKYENLDEGLHMGEKLFVRVFDPDQDVTADHDEITVTVTTAADPTPRQFVLSETLPHSGEFCRVVRTVFGGASEASAETSAETTTTATDA